jgi:dipeptidyl aminopeptidase/acylaminoacyl peptidase
VGNRGLYAVTLSGKLRVLATVTGSLTIQDVSRDGRVLLIDEMRRLGLSSLAPGASKERDLSWLDWSRPSGLSKDGRTIMFYESGEGGGVGYSTYVRKTDGSPPVRLGEGQGVTLSPDGTWAVALLHKLTDPQFVLYPTGAGQPRRLTFPGLRPVGGLRFLPDGRRFVFVARTQGGGNRIYLASLDGPEGAQPRPLTPENASVMGPVSTNGASFVARGPDGKSHNYSTAGGESTIVNGSLPGDTFVGWTPDDRFLYVQRRGAPRATIDKLELQTGRRETWKEFLPADAAGVVRVSSVFVAADGSSYVYAYSRVLSNLYVVDGLK